MGLAIGTHTFVQRIYHDSILQLLNSVRWLRRVRARMKPPQPPCELAFSLSLEVRRHDDPAAGDSGRQPRFARRFDDLGLYFGGSDGARRRPIRCADVG